MSAESKAANEGGLLRCGVAVGSNQGDRLRNLREGVRLLLDSVPGARLTAVAPLYETAAVDCAPGTDPFYNSVIEIECRLEPHALREAAAVVECRLGRPRVRAQNAPRTLDLDLLYCGERVIDDEVLTLPHPMIAQRRFVLQPLADIRPDLVLSGQISTVRAMLDALPGGEVARVRGSDWLEP